MPGTGIVRAGWTAAGIAALLASGCGTITDLKTPRTLAAAPYGGMRMDADVIHYVFSYRNLPSTYPWQTLADEAGPWGVLPVAGVDMLLSAVGDTLVLPYTISRSGEKAKPRGGDACLDFKKGVQETYASHRRDEAAPADFRDVLRNPGAYRDRVLRSRVVLLGYDRSSSVVRYALPPDLAEEKRMGCTPELGASIPRGVMLAERNRPPYQIVFWCSGATEAGGDTRPWVLLRIRPDAPGR